MYAILVRNSNNSYDVLDRLQLSKEAESAFDADWNKDLPVIGINASNHKTTATKGSTWGGTSFDGSVPSGFFEIQPEKHDEYKLYVFLRDNKVIHRIALPAISNKAAQYDAAFAAEVILVKVPEHQAVQPGDNYLWDGTEFLNP